MASTHSYSPFSSAMATTHRNRADRFSYGTPSSLWSRSLLFSWYVASSPANRAERTPGSPLSASTSNPVSSANVNFFATRAVSTAFLTALSRTVAPSSKISGSLGTSFAEITSICKSFSKGASSLSLCRLRVAMSSCMAAHYTGNRPKMKDRVRTSIPLVGFRERGVFCALLDEPASDPVSRLALDGYERGGGDVCHQPTGGGVGRQRFATRLAGRRLDWRVCDAGVGDRPVLGARGPSQTGNHRLPHCGRHGVGLLAHDAGRLAARVQRSLRSWPLLFLAVPHRVARRRSQWPQTRRPADGLWRGLERRPAARLCPYGGALQTGTETRVLCVGWLHPAHCPASLASHQPTNE